MPLSLIESFEFLFSEDSNDTVLTSYCQSKAGIQALPLPELFKGLEDEHFKETRNDSKQIKIP